MAGGVEHQPGGILGLLRILNEHGEAVEYDLIRLGLRLDQLGTKRLSWRDLWVIVRQSGRDSALARSLHGERVGWTQETWLLADIFDVLQAANWQRNLGKGPKPKPFPRPVKANDSTTKTFGSAPLPIDELDNWLRARTTEQG